MEDRERCPDCGFLTPFQGGTCPLCGHEREN